MLKVKVISLPYIFHVLYILCFTRPRYQVSVYRTIGPLVFLSFLLSFFCHTIILILFRRYFLDKVGCVRACVRARVCVCVCVCVCVKVC